MKRVLVYFIFVCLMLACKSEKSQNNEELKVENQIKREVQKVALKEKALMLDYDAEEWQELTEDDGFELDMKYASSDNFTNQVIYPCERCFLRPELAVNLKQLQKDIHKRYGWSLKLYDCYRPKPAQQRLWDIKPDASYVTPPHKGSMHNRGLAIDVSLIDEDGVEFEMGTPFDYFGKRAHTDFTDLPAEILKNRRILKKLMKLHGLSGIRTEWWHYSYRQAKAPIANWEWTCYE